MFLKLYWNESEALTWGSGTHISSSYNRGQCYSNLDLHTSKILKYKYRKQTIKLSKQHQFFTHIAYIEILPHQQIQ